MILVKKVKDAEALMKDQIKAAKKEKNADVFYLYQDTVASPVTTKRIGTHLVKMLNDLYYYELKTGARVLIGKKTKLGEVHSLIYEFEE